MNRIVDLRSLLVAPAGAAVVCAVAACVFGALFPSMDVALVRALNPDEKSAIDFVLRALDQFGPRALLLAGAAGVGVVFLLPRAAGARRAAASVIFAYAWSQATVNVLKHAVGRRRPIEWEGFLGGVREIVPTPDLLRSFPSGHVATASVLAAGAWVVLGVLGVSAARRAALVLVPVAMIWDRVALGHHHPSDAFAGAAIGFAYVAAAAFVSDLLRRRALRTSKAAAAWPWIVAFAVLLVAVPRSGAPVEGAAVGGAVGVSANVEFVERPSPIRICTEPLVGPVLHLARYDRFGVLVPAAVVLAAVVVAALLIARLFGRRAGAGAASAALLFLLPIWTAQFASGASKPARFVASAPGVFVDWHLHAGDRIDGRQIVGRAEAAQRARGVDWAVPTRHDARPDEAPPLARGVLGAEWSGGDYPRTQTAHVLVLGTKAAVDAALKAKTELDAVREGKRAGALVLVAHHWRSAARIPGVPTAEAFAEAGADGFEVANRSGDTDPVLREAALRLDRFCRDRGLLRVSFSDDHGMPSGSPCVTWIEGLSAEDLAGDGGLAIVSRLRRDADPAVRIAAERVVPLVFGSVPEGRAAGVLARPLAFPFEYLRTLGFAQRAAWLLSALAFAFAIRRLR